MGSPKSGKRVDQKKTKDEEEENQKKENWFCPGRARAEVTAGGKCGGKWVRKTIRQGSGEVSVVLHKAGEETKKGSCRTEKQKTG